MSMTSFAGYKVDWIGSYKYGFDVQTLKDKAETEKRFQAGSWKGSALNWTVVASKGYQHLALCDRIVEVKPFNEVRVWLQTEFGPNAFSAEEQRRLGLLTNRTLLDGAGSSMFFEPAFCLSKDEFESFLPADKELLRCTCMAELSAELQAKGWKKRVAERPMSWWLRDEGALACDAKGKKLIGLPAAEPAGIRPAITVNF